MTGIKWHNIRGGPEYKQFFIFTKDINVKILKVVVPCEKCNFLTLPPKKICSSCDSFPILFQSYNRSLLFFRFLLLACDGLWKGFSVDSALKFIKNILEVTCQSFTCDCFKTFVLINLSGESQRLKCQFFSIFLRQYKIVFNSVDKIAFSCFSHAPTLPKCLAFFCAQRLFVSPSRSAPDTTLAGNHGNVFVGGSTCNFTVRQEVGSVLISGPRSPGGPLRNSQ